MILQYKFKLYIIVIEDIKLDEVYQRYASRLMQKYAA